MPTVTYQTRERQFYVKVSKKSPTASDQVRAEVRDLLAWRPVVVDLHA